MSAATVEAPELTQASARFSALPEPDRERVRLEEVFREEVRKSLQQPRTFGQQVLEFFNSSLGLFILSSVVLGGFSTLATTWFNNHQEQARSLETERRLDIEIGFRLHQLPLLANQPVTFTQLHTAKGAVFGKAEYHPQAGKLGEFEPVFPEYLGRSLFSLVWELQRTVPSKDKSQLQAPLAQAKLLPRFFDDMELTQAVGGGDSLWEMPDRDRPKFAAALAALQLTRWQM